jgi:hypothetical protein
VIIDQKLGEFRAKNFDSDSERDKAKQQLKLELVEIMRSSCINSHSRVKRIWIKQNEALLPDIMQKRIDATSN